VYPLVYTVHRGCTVTEQRVRDALAIVIKDSVHCAVNKYETRKLCYSKDDRAMRAI